MRFFYLKKLILNNYFEHKSVVFAIDFIFLLTNMSLLKKLNELLIDREMKTKDLAAKAGISPATLAKMKKDGATVSSDVLVKICTALNCTMDEIVEIVPGNVN